MPSKGNDVLFHKRNHRYFDMKMINERAKPRKSPATVRPARKIRPVITIAPGHMTTAIDEMALRLSRLEDVYRCDGELVRPRHGLKTTLEGLPFSAFYELIERTFEFRAVSSFRHFDPEHTTTIDCPERLARTLFESPKFWTAIPELQDASDLTKAGAA